MHHDHRIFSFQLFHRVWTSCTCGHSYPQFFWKVFKFSVVGKYFWFELYCCLLSMSWIGFKKFIRATFILPPDQLSITICFSMMISVAGFFVFIVQCCVDCSIFFKWAMFCNIFDIFVCLRAFPYSEPQTTIITKVICLIMDHRSYICVWNQIRSTKICFFYVMSLNQLTILSPSTTIAVIVGVTICRESASTCCACCCRAPRWSSCGTCGYDSICRGGLHDKLGYRIRSTIAQNYTSVQVT